MNLADLRSHDRLNSDHIASGVFRRIQGLVRAPHQGIKIYNFLTVKARDSKACGYCDLLVTYLKLLPGQFFAKTFHGFYVSTPPRHA